MSYRVIILENELAVSVRLDNLIVKRYPMDVNVTKDSICNMLGKCVNSIGTKTYSGYGKSMIIDKLISKTLGVDKERLIRLNELEMTFLSE